MTGTPRITYFGVPVDLLTLEQTVALAGEAMLSGKPRRHVALNVAKFVKMRTDEELDRDVRESDIVGIDGMGIALGLKLFGENAVRVPGIDLMEALVSWCAKNGKKPFILGAKQEALETAARNLQARYPGLEFAGLHNGYWGQAEEDGIVAEIRASKADCLFVAMPTPRKERFLHRNAASLGVPFIMGVGGSVDVMAGLVSRAPGWMQSMGLEWLHRLLQEPR